MLCSGTEQVPLARVWTSATPPKGKDARCGTAAIQSYPTAFSLCVCVCMRACISAYMYACVHACVCMAHICVLMNVLLCPHGVLMLAGQLDGVAWFEDTVSKLSH